MLSRLLLGVVGVVAVWAAPPVASEATAKLLQELDECSEEEAAAKIMEPHMADLKNLDASVVERIVLRQWWEVSRDVVAKSHSQKVDLSFAVRKAVRTLKDEADELLRTLNPKYGVAQQVNPAFQWAQNDTCIFFTVKYTVRWNAPGALEATDIVVDMTANSFNFTGLGKHSNNKYKYVLGLNLFDNIIGDQSTWSAASVGKLSVTLKKRWARKWPRLLADKKTKIGNMHVWMEMQDKLDGTLGGMTSVSNSPITCKAAEKLYCLATDSCKKTGNCSQCPGKSLAIDELGLCAGVPSEKGDLNFKDSDMDGNELGGEVKIVKARNEFDIVEYAVYWGKDTKTKLVDAAGKDMLIGKTVPTGGGTELKLPMNTPLPAEATHFLVFSSNEYGEYGIPGSLVITDAVLPGAKPISIEFTDTDGDKGFIGGSSATIKAPVEQPLVSEYSLHWGKTGTKKISSNSHIRSIAKSDKEVDGVTSVAHYFSKGTKIPQGAEYLLAYAKNEHGEHPSGVSLKLVDNKKPCINATDVSCATGVTVEMTASGNAIKLSYLRAIDEAEVTTYSIYWGRKECSHGGQTGIKNGHIKDVPVKDSNEVELDAKTDVPDDTTHILVFTKSDLGEANHCVSAALEKKEDKKEL